MIIERLQSMSQEKRLHTLSNLPAYLKSADKSDQLEDLLLTFEFLAAKVKWIGVQQLIRDYDLTNSEALRHIQRVLQLSANALEVDASLLAGQLMGRLWLIQNETPIQTLLSGIHPEKGQLLPCNETLRSYGSAMRQVLQTDRGMVLKLAIHPDSSVFASVSSDGTIAVWNTSTLRSRFELYSHQKTGHRSIAFHPNGRQLVSADGEGYIYIWDLLTGHLVRKFVAHLAAVHEIFYTPDGKHLLSASEDGTVKIWDSTDDTLVNMVEHPLPVFTLAISHDGAMVASLCANVSDPNPNSPSISVGAMNPIYLWRMTTLEIEKTFTGRSSIAFSHDNSSIATLTEDNSIAIYDIATADRIKKLGNPHTRWQQLMAALTNNSKLMLHPNKPIIATFDQKDPRAFSLWNIETDELRLFETASSEIRSFAFDPSGNTLIAGYLDGTILQWDLNKPAEDMPTQQIHDKMVVELAALPDGSEVIAAGWDRRISRWQMQEHQSTTRYNPVAIYGDNRAVTCIDYSPDGRLFVSGNLNGEIAFWDPAVQKFDLNKDLTRKGVIHFSGVRDAKFDSVSTVMVTPDAQYIVGITKAGIMITVASYLRKSLKENTNLFQSLMVTPERFSDEGGYTELIAFSNDSRYFVIGYQNHSVGLWRIGGRNIIEEVSVLRAHKSTVLSMTFNEQNRLHTFDKEGYHIVWDIKAHKPLTTRQLNLPGFERMGLGLGRDRRIDFSPDWCYAVLCHGQQISVIELESNKTVGTYFADANVITVKWLNNGIIAASDFAGYVLFLTVHDLQVSIREQGKSNSQSSLFSRIVGWLSNWKSQQEL